MAVEALAEEVATNLEEVAEATRRISANGAGYILGGICIGFGIGFFIGYRYNKEKIRAEIFKESAEEVQKMREVYEAKTIAAQVKPSAESIVQEQGYSPVHDERPLPAPVPVREPVSAPPIPHEVAPHSADVGWDFPTELESRSPEKPYVIHQGEVNEMPGYSRVTYTYYAGDDVLCDVEDGHPVTHSDLIVGQQNLKFGHGADDPDVVFVRNDRLETVMEICRVPTSYEEVVLGLNPNETT
jgi:hypothetical protein